VQSLLAPLGNRRLSLLRPEVAWFLPLLLLPFVRCRVRKYSSLEVAIPLSLLLVRCRVYLSYKPANAMPLFPLLSLMSLTLRDAMRL
jgi:hypothetical protein